jgi:hypothetical protein
LRSGSAFVRLALGFARVGCAEWVAGRPAAGRCAQGAGRRAPDVVKPGIHGVGTQWIRGFMAFHGVRRRDLGGGRGRVGDGGYGMMWEKGGVWGRGVI